MVTLIWDSSALSKQYYTEGGTNTVAALFGAADVTHVAAYMVYAETAAILRRKFNEGKMGLVGFNQARFRLEREVLNAPLFTLLSITDADVMAGISLTDAHNLNSTDAAILAGCLRVARRQAAGSACALISADRRLLRAASAEGLTPLNPELLPAADVPGWLASL